MAFLLTECGNVAHILAGYENRYTGVHGNFLSWQTSNGYFKIIGTEIGNHTPWEPPHTCDYTKDSFMLQSREEKGVS